jgi:hypothetical protein
MERRTSVVLGLAGALGLAAIATFARVLIFFVQFDASWPAMFCYGPEGAFMFEGVAGIPLLAASIACALVLGHSRATVPVAIAASTVSAFLLFRAWQLVQALTGRQYDEGCGRLAAWAWQYPLLNLVTKPMSASVVFAIVTLAMVVVMYGAVKARVA